MGSPLGYKHVNISYQGQIKPLVLSFTPRTTVRVGVQTAANEFNVSPDGLVFLCHGVKMDNNQLFKDAFLNIGKSTIIYLIESRKEKDKPRQSDARCLFDEAMKDGHVLLHTCTLLLMGVAGSGKSSVKDLLLDNPPKVERSSTSCRDRVLHVRPVTNHLFQSTGEKWEEVSQQEMVSLLALAVQHLPRSSLDSLSAVLQSRLRQRLAPSIPSDSTLSSSAPVLVSPVQQAIVTVVNLVLEAMPGSGPAQTYPIRDKELFGTKTVRVTDNGGQPQFQDIAPLFIRHASAGLFVMRLTDDFDDCPFDDLYKDGKLVGTPSPSHLTHGETILSLLRSFSSFGHNSQFIFVGTFLDRIRDHRIVLEKNKRLFELLPPELRSEVVYSNHRMDKILFTLNACSRDATTKEVAQEIRKAVEGSASLDFEVPLWWFIIELSLHNLCSLLERGILRKSECVDLAECLGFHPDALVAALMYFDEMCIAHYYPEILPDIVFVDPQVPLDKISELTQHAISLRNARDDTVVAVPPKWRRFRDEGVLTVDMLESKEFQKHFKEGLFTPSSLIAIMKELLIIAPLTIQLPGDAESPLSQMEFFMPTLLTSIPPSGLEEHRVFSPSADPLLIRFLSGCVRCGVFCCLVVYLMRRCEWQVCLPSGEPVLLARNCVKFRLPCDPCIITLIDSFSLIEVHIQARPRVCQQVCPIVRRNIVEGVNAVSKILHYQSKNDKPITSFFCPHEKSVQESVSPKRHYAEIYPDSGLWCCSKDVNLDGDLRANHTVWFSSHTSETDQDVDEQINVIARRVGIIDRMLDQPCESLYLLPISQRLTHWHAFAEYLGLTRVEIHDIQTNLLLTAPHSKGLEMLQTWQRMCAGTDKATYRYLLKGCVAILRDLRLVEEICKLLLPQSMVQM